ncbi:MFS transporter [Micromonospora sp. KC606]|uniref:MFS transporter n=1 Tax=Micromonospora sp. KC606 TaxID=2530379 RepID=UPI00104F6FB1|nr:MFS transporter [Micromonospora sp. KC606]TDC76965.1 MFS transporter [Micromonospora sp. KC606]
MTKSLAPERVGRTPLWRRRDFALLWGGQTIGEFGARSSGVVVPLVAADTLAAGVFQVSLLTALAWLPYLLFSLPAGLVADRVDQRRLMIGCDLGRAALLASVPLVGLVGQLTLPYLYVVVGLNGVLTVFFTVAYKSVVPRLVPADQLVEGNARLTVSEDAAQLVGPAVGGALAGALGGARTLLGTTVAFLVSAATLGLIRSHPATGATRAQRVPARVALTEGLGFVRRHPVLLSTLLCATTSNFFGMATASLEVPYLLRELRAAPAVVGVVVSAGAVGGLVAGLLAARIAARVGSARVIWVAMAAPGPFYLLMPAAQPGWGLLLYAVGLAAYSANAVLFNVALVSYRQRVTPPELLGRVTAAFLWVCFGAVPLGALFGGALADAWGMRPTLVVTAVGTWSAALFVVCSPLRTMRDLPSGCGAGDG